MSQENLVLLATWLDCWNRGDVDGFVDLTSDEVEIFTALAGVEGSYRGREGARRWYADLHDIFPDWHAEAIDVQTVRDATIAKLRVTGHGGRSGTPVDEILWHVIEWRSGHAVRMSRHDSGAETLEAAGLSE